jgi:hypothetical protein
MRLVRDGMIRNVTGGGGGTTTKNTCLNDTEARMSQTKPSLQSVRNIYKHLISVQFICVRLATLERLVHGTAHNIREVSGSYTYVPDFITAALSFSGIKNVLHAIGLRSGINTLTT